MPHRAYRPVYGPLFSKDDTRKLAILAIAFLASFYCYFSFLLGPLNQQRTSTIARLTELQGKLAGSEDEIQKTERLTVQGRSTVTRYTSLMASIPAGAAIAWFPPRLKALLQNDGLDQASVRISHTTAFKQPELAIFVKTQWSVELANAGFEALGQALARMENQEALLEVNQLKVAADPADPEFQHVALGVGVIVKQAE
jgi:hypothetical protein